MSQLFYYNTFSFHIPLFLSNPSKKSARSFGDLPTENKYQEGLDMNQSAISHQLRILKQSRLVKFRRDGKSVFYSLADAHVRTMIAQGMEHISE